MTRSTSAALLDQHQRQRRPDHDRRLTSWQRCNKQMRSSGCYIAVVAGLSYGGTCALRDGDPTTIIDHGAPTQKVRPWTSSNSSSTAAPKPESALSNHRATYLDRLRPDRYRPHPVALAPRIWRDAVAKAALGRLDNQACRLTSARLSPAHALAPGAIKDRRAAHCSVREANA